MRVVRKGCRIAIDVGAVGPWRPVREMDVRSRRMMYVRAAQCGASGWLRVVRSSSCFWNWVCFVW